MKTNTDRKQLIRDYKLKKTERGVIGIKSKSNGKMLVDVMTNLHGAFETYKIGLALGNCWIRPLQEDYNEFGSDNFEYLVIDVLKEPDEASPEYDYRGDLTALAELWREKFSGEGVEFYNAKLTKLT
jgi:hypothetical protein